MMIEVQAASGPAEAWVSTPDGGGTHPGVLFYMDAIGLRPRLHEMADRIASWGYVALVPNVFYRDGTAAQTSPAGELDSDEARTAFFEKAMPRVHGLIPDQSRPDTDAWLDALTSRDDVSTPVGVVGYCMGARLAVRAAGDHPDLVAACAGFHGGGLVTEDADSPHASLSTARAEFVFGHADNDRSMTPDNVRTLGEALDEAHLTASNEVYTGAPHGYSMSDTAAYDHEATERSFSELRAVLDRTLR
ncbi:dienelactone hydrolase family protein [Allobranchiibius sp. GilTou38]|uniref:dienelactone hydrolase family protein n=1 Tax=Allobranchiibius sp. GilTou38 TaxID=2815210 RepID=UPI001AA0FBE1|nr:dienelactone hydrolase family protein [Allobranchiibius sp. GilTou38]MBO1766471.1 dienelactone hydrolase family protein [Allobranchiibius sp. GilTou38]